MRYFIIIQIIKTLLMNEIEKHANLIGNNIIVAKEGMSVKI